MITYGAFLILNWPTTVRIFMEKKEHYNSLKSHLHNHPTLHHVLSKHSMKSDGNGYQHILALNVSDPFFRERIMSHGHHFPHQNVTHPFLSGAGNVLRVCACACVRVCTCV